VSILVNVPLVLSFRSLPDQKVEKVPDTKIRRTIVQIVKIEGYLFLILSFQFARPPRQSGHVTHTSVPLAITPSHCGDLTWRICLLVA
jgi:hypothetical protein